jgi:hypothetical protein
MATLLQVAEACEAEKFGSLYIVDNYKPKDALLKRGYIEMVGLMGDRYQLTPSGKDYLRSIGRPFNPRWVNKPKKRLNRGLATYRLRSNPEEERFALAWEENNQPLGTPGIGPVLAALLNPNQEVSPISEPTPREREVAATVVQWLGSPSGQAFLRDLGYVRSSPER